MPKRKGLLPYIWSHAYLAELFSPRVIIRQSSDIVLKGEKPGRSEETRLPHPPTQDLAHPPGF